MYSKEKINIEKEYQKLLDNNPAFIKEIISYEAGEDNSIILHFKDGKTGWYYPLNVEPKKKTIKKSKKHGTNNK